MASTSLCRRRILFAMRPQHSLAFTDLVETLPVSAFVIDTKACVVAWNQIAEDQFPSITPGECITERLTSKPEELREFLTRASRSRTMLMGGSEWIDDTGGRVSLQLRAGSLRSIESPETSFVLLSVQQAVSDPTGFSALNQRIHSLRSEVAARHRAEDALRELHEAITEPTSLEERFARILEAGMRRFEMQVSVLTRQHADHTEVVASRDRSGNALACGRLMPIRDVALVRGVFDQLAQTGWVIEHDHPLFSCWTDPGIAMHITQNGHHHGTLLFAGPLTARDPPRTLEVDWMGISTRWLASEFARAEAFEQNAALELRMQATQKLESLGTLAGGIAHDFNNLLVGILGNASIALEHTSRSDELYETLSQIERAAVHGAELTRALLAYSGRGRIRIEPLDLAEQVSELSTLLPLTGHARLQISRTSERSIIQGDSARLQQVIMNLLTNAVDAVRAGHGRIYVETGASFYGDDTLARGVVDAGVGVGWYAYLEVNDEGCGMDAATAGRLFDPFFTTKPDGHGLGMASVLGIVRSHRGVIHLDTAPGRGTRIRVSFPLVEDREGDRAGLSNAHPQPLAKRTFSRALVVDDDAVVRQVCARMLRALGMETVACDSGRSALQTLAGNSPPFDVIVLDLSMPEMSGLDALRKLRERHPELPVLISSGDPADAVPIVQVDPFTHLLPKPYTRRDLATVLSTVAARSGGHSDPTPQAKGEPR